MEPSVHLHGHGLDRQNLDLALITPSYAPDFERCRLLCQTRERCLPASVKHYIVVDKRDLALFNALKNRQTEILTVEDILPWWIQRVPFSKQGWISLKTLPIRNWVLQQLVKLSVANIVNEGILGFVDSDVAFLRSFDPKRLVQGGKVRLYRESNSIPAEWQSHRRWYDTASRLLGTPAVNYPAPNFIGDLVTFKRENMLKLQQYLEARSGKSWLETLAGTLHWSEYILYGMYVEFILKDEAGHFYDEQYPGLQHFSTQSMSTDEIREFLSELKPHHVTVMLSAKAKIPVQRYEQLVLNLSEAGQLKPTSWLSTPVGSQAETPAGWV